MLSTTFPPIPGGSLACYTILFAQLGIPAEALSLVIILDIITDFTSTGFNVVLRQCELVVSADKIGMLDKARLQAKKAPSRNPG